MHQTKLYLIVVSLGLLAQAALSQSVEWPSYNGDLTATRFSPLTEISPGNVNSLRPACTYDTAETAVFQSGLLMVRDVLYFTTYNTTYAVDASTCALKWKYSRPGPARGLGVNRGVAYLDGKVFRGTGDAHLFALDVATGQPAWDATLGDPADAESVPMAPIAWNGIVFAGNAGGDNFGVTGRVYAFSAADGHELWRFNVVPESGRARGTWKNVNSRNPPTGGATWTTYSLDPDVTAVDADTGRVRWKYKSPTPMLAAVTPTAGGLVFTGDLNGDVLALDASNGSVLWRHATGSALGGGIISYESGGHQRLAVAAGLSAVNWPLPKINARVIVYSLP